MDRYKNGKIYQVVDVGFNKCYIGSTTETLSQRMARHRRHYNEYLKGSKRRLERSMMLFDEYGLENCKIILIKDFPCNSRAELEREEGEEILNNIDKCVNKNVVGRTRKEYYRDNQERFYRTKGSIELTILKNTRRRTRNIVKTIKNKSVKDGKNNIRKT